MDSPPPLSPNILSHKLTHNNQVDHIKLPLPPSLPQTHTPTLCFLLLIFKSTTYISLALLETVLDVSLVDCFHQAAHYQQNAFMNPHVRLLVGWSVGPSVFIS